MNMPSDPVPPMGVDLQRPSPARMYDWYLGGTANWAVDRIAGEKAKRIMPWVAETAKANRRFVHRAVHYCSRQGISQFVDIGSGVPTVGNVHEVADWLDQRSHCVYVDSEPVAVGHGQILLEQHGDLTRHAMINADLRNAEHLWSSVCDTGLIDPSQPLALLATAVLHFMSPGTAESAMEYYRDRLPAGSYLVLSHGTLDGMRPEHREMFDVYTAHYGTTQNPVTWRSQAEFGPFFGDLELVDPGITWTSEWRPEEEPPGETLEENFELPSDSMVYAGIGYKP